MKKMTSLILLLIFILIKISCEEKSRIIEYDVNDLYIGKILDDMELNFIEGMQSGESIIDSTFAFPYFKIISNDVVYKICYDWNKKVRRIVVDSEYGNENFKTPEGAHLNMTYEELKKIVSTKKIGGDKCVGYYYKLKSGWFVAFWIGETGIDRYPQGEDMIYQIFIK